MCIALEERTVNGYESIRSRNDQRWKSEIFLHSEYGNNGDRTPSDKIF